jgi:hypothetical protein
MRYALLFAALMSLGLAEISARLALREWRAAGFAVAPPADQAEILLGDDLPLALSLRGQRGMLLACDDAMLADGARLLPPEAGTQIALRCRGIADAILARAPDWGLAHLASAAAAFALGDQQATARGLGASTRAAPFESWLALQRVRLALRALEGPGPDLPSVGDDIAALAQSPDGRRGLARLALTSPDLRARLADSGARMPAAGQALLADAIAAARREAGS